MISPNGLPRNELVCLTVDLSKAPALKPSKYKGFGQA